MRAAGLHVSNKKGGEGKGNWGALGDAAVAPLGELEPLSHSPLPLLLALRKKGLGRARPCAGL